MIAEIIAVGSELLTPFRQDTNSLYLTAQLNSLGVEVGFKTIVGDISFGPDGEWAEPRPLFVQYHGIKDNNLDQFRDDSRITILYPEKYKSGKLAWPYTEARK